MAKGFNAEQLRQISELIVGTMQQMNLVPPREETSTLNFDLVSAPATPKQNRVAVTEKPVTFTAPVPSPKPSPLVYPMEPIHGVKGERFLELANLGKGDYSELSNTLFALIRADVLGATDYSLLTKQDKTRLNKYITEVMSERVNEIRRLNREAAKQNTALEARSEQPAPTIEAKLPDPTPPAPKLVLPTDKVTSPQVAEPSPMDNDDGLGPIGRKEVENLVKLARENVKNGTSLYSTLNQWAKRESNQRRKKIAGKIFVAAAKQLGLMKEAS